MITRKIGFLLFDGMNALDLTGPLEAFHCVTHVGTHTPYRFFFIGLERKAYTAESGFKMMAELTMDEVDELDTLFIPGGRGSRSSDNQGHISPWLTRIKPHTRRMVSICTGAFLLAASGLLKNRKATTHWAFTEQLSEQYPDVTLEPDALYVDSGDIATSAGITSGIDLALKLIDNDLGAKVAADVARYLVVHLRRAGDQAQFSVPLQYQIKTDSIFTGLTGWILDNLQDDLSIERIASHCGMSERNFCRRFCETVGSPPGRYVEHLRLDYARQLLTEQDWPLSQVSDACGYHNTDAFRRAFERRFSVTPKIYRARFSQ